MCSDSVTSELCAMIAYLLRWLWYHPKPSLYAFQNTGTNGGFIDPAPNYSVGAMMVSIDPVFYKYHLVWIEIINIDPIFCKKDPSASSFGTSEFRSKGESPFSRHGTVARDSPVPTDACGVANLLRPFGRWWCAVRNWWRLRRCGLLYL